MKKKIKNFLKSDTFFCILLPGVLALFVAVPFFLVSYYALTNHGLGFSLLVAAGVYLASFIAGYDNMVNQKPH